MVHVESKATAKRRDGTYFYIDNKKWRENKIKMEEK